MFLLVPLAYFEISLLFSLLCWSVSYVFLFSFSPQTLKCPFHVAIALSHFQLAVLVDAHSPQSFVRFLSSRARVSISSHSRVVSVPLLCVSALDHPVSIPFPIICYLSCPTQVILVLVPFSCHAFSRSLRPLVLPPFLRDPSCLLIHLSLSLSLPPLPSLALVCPATYYHSRPRKEGAETERISRETIS